MDQSKVLGKKAGFEVKGVLGISSKRPELAREFWKRLPGHLEQGLLVPIKGRYEITSSFTTDTVNGILDTFKKPDQLKHAHLHL